MIVLRRQDFKPHLPLAGSRPMLRWSATRREAALLLALGVGLRLVWMALAHALTQPVHLGEASNAALALARQGVIADAFFPDQGATAHLLPTCVLISGGLYRLLGPDSAAANMALALWSLAQVFVGFGLAALLFRQLGWPRPMLLGGLALLCLNPGYIAQETADFRVWEGALAFDLAAANLLWLATLADRPAIVSRDLVISSALSAVAFFVSPPAGLAVDACWAVFALRRLGTKQRMAFAMLAAATLAVLVVPWAMRNQSAVGEPVWLRSNFGLEFAIANHPAAVDPLDPAAVLGERMRSIHPGASPAAAAALRAAGGEVRYAHRLGEATWVWAGEHPIAFLRLLLRHYRQFYVPDTWQETLTNWQGLNRLRITAVQLVAALGLAGLLLGLARRRRGYSMLALYIAVAGLPYALVQPIPRYGYIVYPLLAFLAVRLVFDLFRYAGPGTDR